MAAYTMLVPQLQDLYIASFEAAGRASGAADELYLLGRLAYGLRDLGPHLEGTRTHAEQDAARQLLRYLVLGLSETSLDWPEALRHRGRLQEIPEQRLSSQRGLAEFENQVSHLHDLLVELGRNIEDRDRRLASGVRVKQALQEVVATTTDQRLKRHRELSRLMLDAVRHVPSEILTVRHLSALEECTDRLSQARLTQDDLAVCDSALLAAGLDSLPDLGDDDE